MKAARTAEPRPPELRHLRYFVAVAEELHFGRAAERLHMSQPPLSMQIQALERSLGVQLLVRTQRQVSLTRAGEAFLRESRQILARLEAAGRLARRVSRGEVGELAVGFVSSADYNVLPPLLREFRQRAPDVRLTLHESTTDRQLEALVQGRLDVGFVLPPVEDPRIAYRALHREPLLAALPSRHALARRRGPVPVARLADQPFILFPRELAPGLYDDIVSFCRSAGFSPRVEQEAVQMQTILSLVSADMGVALIPASLVHLGRTGVTYKPLREAAPQTEIGVAWRRDDSLATLHLFLDAARRFSTVGGEGAP
jgi:DNA-binding transcriptional LysR family regulator